MAIGPVKRESLSSDIKPLGSSAQEKADLVHARAFGTDLSVALAARAGHLKFAELPIPLSPTEVVRIAAKSAAVWSLKANAATHPLVKELCSVEAKKPGGAARSLLASS